MAVEPVFPSGGDARIPHDAARLARFDEAVRTKLGPQLHALGESGVFLASALLEVQKQLDGVLKATGFIRRDFTGDVHPLNNKLELIGAVERHTENLSARLGSLHRDTEDQIKTIGELVVGLTAKS